MPLPFLVLFCVLCGGYALFMAGIWIGMRRLYPRENGYHPFVSICVAARNEEEHIPACLHSLVCQNYPHDRMEILVVDDASEDATAPIVEKFSKSHPLVKLVRQAAGERGAAPKKRALALGVAASSGEIIFTIDADCTAPPSWIESMLAYFTPQTGVVFGWVGFRREQERGFWRRLQSLEYISWFGVAAGFAGLGIPTMANANNLAFRKKAFDEVGGYQGIDHIVSGDDELLVQKISDQSRWRTAFCGGASAMTFTAPCPTVASFINQRSRWASKGLIYRRMWLRILLVSLFLFYASLPLLLVFSFIYPGLDRYFGACILVKISFDAPLAWYCTGKTGKRRLLPLFLVTEGFHMVYVPLVALAGTFGLYSWKAKR